MSTTIYLCQPTTRNLFFMCCRMGNALLTWSTQSRTFTNRNVLPKKPQIPRIYNHPEAQSQDKPHLCSAITMKHPCLDAKISHQLHPCQYECQLYTETEKFCHQLQKIVSSRVSCKKCNPGWTTMMRWLTISKYSWITQRKTSVNWGYWRAALSYRIIKRRFVLPGPTKTTEANVHSENQSKLHSISINSAAILTVNVRSSRKNLGKLETLVYSREPTPSAVCLTETWLTEDDKSV